MDRDYPAAHSTDSCWFAVDRDGFVAYFDTGESGAMPESGYQGEEASDLCNRLIRDLPASDVLHDPAGLLLPIASEGRLELYPSDTIATLVFLTSLAPAQSDIEAGRATTLRATEGYAVLYRRLSAEQARRLNDSGAVRASDFYFGAEDAGAGGLARHGIFEYGHLCENWIAGPYGRKLVPTRAIHVDQLPPNIRRNLIGTRLADRSFAETTHLQPVEHWPCQSWEPGWLGTDGRRQPFPGREDEFAEQDEDN